MKKGAKDDDVFVSLTKPPIEQFQAWKLPIIEQKRDAESDAASTTPTKLKEKHRLDEGCQHKRVIGLGLDFNTSLDNHAYIHDEQDLDTPPLSPAGSTAASEYDLPELATTPRTPELLQLPKFSNKHFNALAPRASPADVPRLEVTELKYDESTSEVSNIPADPQVCQAFELHSEIRNILHSDRSTCSDCTVINIDNKHFAKLCNYMVEHDLYDHRHSVMDTLRSFRPLRITKIFAIVKTDELTDVSTRIFSLDRRSEIYRLSSFADLFAYQRVHGDELKITCQIRCVEHGRNAVWTFEQPTALRDGAGSLKLLTNRMFAQERKHFLAKKLDYSRY